MARWYEPDEKQMANWREWKVGRPAEILDLAERFPPWELYRAGKTGQRVFVTGYIPTGEHRNCGDDTPTTKATLIVAVSGRFNLVSFERQVMGVDPDDLEPCELPCPGESVGSFTDLLGLDENDPQVRNAIVDSIRSKSDVYEALTEVAIERADTPLRRSLLEDAMRRIAGALPQ